MLDRTTPRVALDLTEGDFSDIKTALLEMANELREDIEEDESNPRYDNVDGALVRLDWLTRAKRYDMLRAKLEREVW